MPADRTQALRTAFDLTMKDPGFLAEAVKIGVEVSAMLPSPTAAALGLRPAENFGDIHRSAQGGRQGPGFVERKP